MKVRDEAGWNEWQANVLLMYPLQDGTPAERALFHVDNAAHFVSLAGNAISAFAIHASRPANAITAEYGMASAAGTCAWNLESAKWHLSQIPAPYRRTARAHGDDEPDSRFYPCCGSFWEDGCRCEVPS